MSKCQFEQVGTHQGRPILRPRDSTFQTRAREFLQRHQQIQSHLHYLANFASNEGWSGQLESDAGVPDELWQLLGALCNSKHVSNVIKTEQVDIESPWGAIRSTVDGSCYMVLMGSDGSPIAIQKGVKALGIDVARSSRWRSVLAGILFIDL
jgi:hypothetical protein